MHKCPICGRVFKSDNCPHTYTQAERAQQQNNDGHLKRIIRSVVRDELKKAGLIECDM